MSLNIKAILGTCKEYLLELIEKNNWKKDITKWIFYVIWPYALGIICINFFLTIAAVSLVLYISSSIPLGKIHR